MSAESVAEEVESGQQAVQIGVFISAIRCLITYLWLPAMSATSSLIGLVNPLALALQVVAAMLAISGTRRLYKVGHRWAKAYAVLSVIMVAMAVHTAWLTFR